MSKKYSPQFKQEAIHYVNSHADKSMKMIARELDISYSSLKTWCREARVGQTPKGIAARSIQELERENHKLNNALILKEKEIEILKKFSVYLAKQQP